MPPATESREPQRQTSRLSRVGRSRPGGDGSLLDHTTILWTNELGEGNSHSHEHIPWVLVGGGLGFKTGRALDFPGVPHNRLLVSLARAMGHESLARFGNPDYCGDGPLEGLA